MDDAQAQDDDSYELAPPPYFKSKRSNHGVHSNNVSSKQYKSNVRKIYLCSVPQFEQSSDHLVV